MSREPLRWQDDPANAPSGAGIFATLEPPSSMTPDARARVLGAVDEKLNGEAPITPSSFRYRRAAATAGTLALAAAAVLALVWWSAPKAGQPDSSAPVAEIIPEQEPSRLLQQTGQSRGEPGPGPEEEPVADAEDPEEASGETEAPQQNAPSRDVPDVSEEAQRPTRWILRPGETRRIRGAGIRNVRVVAGASVAAVGQAVRALRPGRSRVLVEGPGGHRQIDVLVRAETVAAAAAAPPHRREVRSLSLNLGDQQTLDVTGVESYSVGVDGQVIDIRVTPTGRIGVVATATGTNTLLLLSGDGREILFRIEVQDGPGPPRISVSSRSERSVTLAVGEERAVPGSPPVESYSIGITGQTIDVLMKPSGALSVVGTSPGTNTLLLLRADGSQTLWRVHVRPPGDAEAATQGATSEHELRVPLGRTGPRP